MKKILFIATVVKTHIMEFHIPILKMFKEMGWTTSVAAKNDYENPNDCIIPYCDSYYEIPFERNPLKLQNVKAFQQLKIIINKENYDIIHCHTPVGALIGRLSAKNARKQGTKVFYTAHGFHFYSGAPLKNWLLYYPVEKFMALFTDVLITINQEDFKRANRNFNVIKKIVYIPGVGIDTNKFYPVNSNKKKRTKLASEDFILISVGELIPRKNHKIVIEAMGLLKNREGFDKIHYLICGTGPEMLSLKRLTITLKIEDHVHFLGYQHNIANLCHVSDLFVFMSLQEGLPVALMEAMSCGLPVVCTKIRGNTDLVINKYNGIYCNNNANDLADIIWTISKNPKKYKILGNNARNSVEKFELSIVQESLKNIYLESLI